MGTKLHIYIILLSFGLSIGSFLNVCIYRIPRKISIWKGRSVCPFCQHNIRWQHLIPILNFFQLRGKCFNCHRPISWQYPLIELFTGLWTIFLFHQTGISIQFVFFLTLFYLLIIISVIDGQFKRIPNPLIWFGILSGLILKIVTGSESIFLAILNGFFSGALLWGLSILSRLVIKKSGFGCGDIKLMIVLGLFLGIKGAIIILILGSVFGAAIGIIGLIIGKLKAFEKIPFAPFITSGAVLYMLFSRPIESFFKLIFQTSS